MTGKAGDTIALAKTIVKNGDEVFDAAKIADKAEDAVDAAKTVSKPRSPKGQAYLDEASNEGLKNTIDDLYRPGATFGDGGTADALRYELKTGQYVGGKSHIQKGRDRIKNLERLLREGNLNENDTRIATELLNDLKNAFGGK